MEHHQENSFWRPAHLPMLDQVFVVDFRNAVSLIQEPSSLNASPWIQTRGDHLRRIRELISGPVAFSYCDFPDTTLLSECPWLKFLGQEDNISSLQILLCDDELKQELDSEAPGLRCRAFHTAICITHVSVNAEGVPGLHSIIDTLKCLCRADK